MFVDLIGYWLDLLNCAFYLRLEMHTSIGLSASCKILITNADLRMDLISRLARSVSEWGFVSLSRKSRLFLYIRGGSRVYMLCNLIVFCICGESLHTMLPIIEELQANTRPISNQTPRYILGMSSVLGDVLNTLLVSPSIEPRYVNKMPSTAFHVPSPNSCNSIIALAIYHALRCLSTFERSPRRITRASISMALPQLVLVSSKRFLQARTYCPLSGGVVENSSNAI